MHKNVKSVVAKTLAVALAVTTVVTTAPAGEATAAKKPVLSAKKVTVTAGKSKKVNIKNVKAKKVKKLKVTVDKKKIATVKKNGKTSFTIKGKKIGTAKVTAKVKIGKKTTKLTVKVTVKKVAVTTPAPSNQPTTSVAPTVTSTSAPTGTPAVTPSTNGELASSTPDTTTVPEETSIPAKVIVNDSFDENTGDWFGRCNSEADGSISVKLSLSDESCDGTGKSMLIDGRKSAWNGAGLDAKNLVVPGGTYRVSFYAKIPNGADKTKLKLRFSGAYVLEEGDSENYENYPRDKDQNLTQKNWTYVEETFTTQASLYTYLIYFESNGNGKCPILVDNFKLEEITTPKAADLTLDSIKDVYSPYFDKVGTAVSYATLINNSQSEFVTHHYNSITYGNDTKPDAILGSKNTLAVTDANAANYYIPDNYSSFDGNKDADGNVVLPEIDFASIDKYLKKADSLGLKVRYHAFIWHQQMPHHFFTVGYSDESDAKYVDEETMYAREEMFIKSVLNHIFAPDYKYRDVVYAVDVVNEYIHMDQIAKDSDNWWRHIFGEEMKLDCVYVKKAFKYAYEALQNNNKETEVSLFYNDYNTYDSPESVVTLINNINATDGINPNGDKICSGVGMQAHFNDSTSDTNATRIKKSLDAFREAGFEIQITELDITNCGFVTTDSTAEEKAKVEEKSAQSWKEVMEVILDEKVNQGANITALVIWGTTDNTSWRPSKSPLLFGADIADVKPSFYAVINAAKNFKASK